MASFFFVFSIFDVANVQQWAPIKSIKGVPLELSSYTGVTLQYCGPLTCPLLPTGQRRERLWCLYLSGTQLTQSHLCSEAVVSQDVP